MFRDLVAFEDVRRLTGTGRHAARQPAVVGCEVGSADGSRAEANGLREGDIIVAASSGRFDDLAGFRLSFGKTPQALVLRVRRGDAQADLLMR